MRMYEKPLKKRWEILEHTADQYIRAYGRDLEEALINAGLALFDTMTDIKTVNKIITPQEIEHFTMEEETLEGLLYAFIEECLVKWELTNKLFSKIETVLVDRGSNPSKRTGKTDPKYWLSVSLYGETYNPEKHPSKVGVKAMTYCNMKIDIKPNRVILEFVIDI